MIYKTDHSFQIGEQHLRQGKPCQDYALSGVTEANTAFAIVSDGCSSGGETDIGARLLSLATKQALLDERMSSVQSTAVFSGARDAYVETYRKAFGLDYRDLLATNLYAVVSNGEVRVEVIGDGIVAFVYTGGTVIYDFAWHDNMPYYPIYRLAGGNEAFINHHNAEPVPLRMTEAHCIDGTESVETHAHTYSIKDAMSGVSLLTHINAVPKLGPLQAVGLFSDRVEHVDQLDTIPTVRALMSFKSTNGQFAVRRMNRFLKNARANGKGPLDDIAMAVICLKDQKGDNHDTDQATHEA